MAIQIDQEKFNKLFTALLWYQKYNEIPFKGISLNDILEIDDPVKYRINIARFWYLYYNNKLNKKYKSLVDKVVS